VGGKPVMTAVNRVQQATAALLLLVVAGCGGQTLAPSATEGRRIGAIVTTHNMMERATGRLPPNEQEFKKFIAENGSQSLERAGVTAVDELFVSDRDGQPLVVIYGKYPAGMNAKVVVYEENGADGKRFVGYNSGAVELVDDARFNELVTASTTPK
jgi:hypothetical protein